MTFGSLFAGIGGFDLGLERAGMTCKWQVEKDDYARDVLAEKWPEVARYRDVRYFLGSKRWRQAREAWGVDVVCGGFPCQDISNAGTRAGITGERSGLWSEYARIVGLLRPRFVIVENVDALYVRGIGRVLGDLAALGYDAEWDRIPAASVGAPHRRWRVFIVAYAQSLGWLKRGTESVGRHASRCGRSDVPDANGERFTGRSQRNESTEGRIESPRWRNPSGSRHEDVSDPENRFAGQRWRKQFAAYCQSQRDLFWPETQPPVCGVVDGVPHRVDRLRCLGNAVVPQVAEFIGRMIIESDA